MKHMQVGFDLGPVPSRQPYRNSATGRHLFIAARPDRPAAMAAQSIAREFRDHYRIDRQPLPDWRLHVTLIGLGRHETLPASLVYHAREALDHARFAPFEIAFDRVMSFGSGSSHPVVLCLSARSAALDRAVGRLASALAGLGVDCRYEPGFQAHMTLIYHTRPVGTDELPAPVRWTVDRFWLVESLHGQGSYDFLWPLKACHRPQAPSAERFASSRSGRWMSMTDPPGS